MGHFSDTSIDWDEIFNRRNKKLYEPRFKITIRNNSLSDYDKNIVEYTFNSSTPKDAIRRAETVLKRNQRLSYYAKQYLEALIISAEADLSYV